MPRLLILGSSPPAGAGPGGPSALVLSAVITPSGESVAIRFVQNLAAVNPSGITLSVDGVNATLSAPLWGARDTVPGVGTPAPYDPWLMFLISAPVSSSAVVTFSAPAGAITLADSTSAAIANLAVTNPGVILAPIGTGARTMKLGYNVNGDGYYASGRIRANLASGVDIANRFVGVVTDVNGYPTQLPSGMITIMFNVADLGSDFGGSGKGTHSFPQGRHRIVWDGADTFTVSPQNGTTVVSIFSSIRGPGGIGNEIVVDITDTTNFSPAWGLRLTPAATAAGDGTTAISSTNWRFWPPDPADATGATAWASPPKYHPSAKAQFGSAVCDRGMDRLPTNACNVVDYADLCPPTAVGYNGVVRSAISRITRMEAYTGTDKLVVAANRTRVLITTATPHGLADGQSVTLGTGIGMVATNLGAPYDPASSGGSVKVLSSTTFVMPIYAYGSSPQSVMTNVLTPSATTATVRMDVVSGGMPFEDIFAWDAYLGSDTWLNIPHAASDACVAAMANFAAANLGAGRKLHVEYSNECWNFGTKFKQWEYCIGMSQVVLGIASPYEVPAWQFYRSAQVHAIFTAAFVAAGVPTSRLRRVIGSSPGAAGSTYAFIELGSGSPSRIAAYTGLSSNPLITGLGTVTFDEIAVTSYVNNRPFFYPLYDGYPVVSLKSITDVATTGQCLDLYELTVTRDWEYQRVALHASMIAASSLATKPTLVMYEGNLQSVLPFTDDTGDHGQTPNQGPRGNAVYRHPRIGNIAQGVFRQWERAGVTLANLYYMNGANYYAHWDTFQGYSMLPGTGLESGATNVSDPANIPGLRSVVGKALNDWMALVPPDVVAAPPVVGARGPLARRRLAID